MKSITARMQEIRDIGKIEEDGTTFSNVAKALTSIGIAAVDTAGQIRPMQEIMNELGPMWETLDQNHKAYISTVLAGNRQQSRFIALMDNYDRALELVNTSQNAAGESARQLRAYDTGLESSFQKLSNAWQVFASRISDSSTISGLVKTLAELIEIVNSFPEGLIQTITYVTLLSKGLKALDTIAKSTKGIALIDMFKGSGFETEFGRELLPGITNTLDKVKGKFKDTFAKIGLDSGKVMSDSMGVGLNKSIEGFNQMDKSAKDFLLTSESIAGAHATQTGVLMAQTAKTAEYAKEADIAAIAVQNTASSIIAQERAMSGDNPEFDRQITQTIGLAKSSVSANKSLIGSLEEEVQSAESNKQYWSNGGTTDANRLLQDEEKKLRSKYKRSNKKDTSENISLFEDTDLFKISEDEYVEQNLGGMKKQIEDGIKNQIALQDEIIVSKRAAIDKITASNMEVEEIINDVTKSSGKKKEDSISRLLKAFNPIEGQSELPSKVVGSPKTTNKVNLKGLGALKNGGLTKGISGLSKAFNLTSVAGGAMMGMMTNMIATSATGSEEVGSFAGTFVGLGSVLGKLGPKGWIAAAAIAGLKFAFDTAFPSVEKVTEQLEKIAKEQDDLKAKMDETGGALDSYQELSNKLELTEEEQEKLNSSAAALAKIVPKAVTGYDHLGNAIIDVTQAQEKLNEMMVENVALAAKSNKGFAELQRAQIGGLEKIGNFLVNTVEWITNAPGKITEAVRGETMTLSGLWSADIAKRQLEGQKKVITENYSEIFGNYQTIISEAITSGSKEGLNQRQAFGNNVLNNILQEAMGSKDAAASDLSKITPKIDELFNSVDGYVIDKVLSIGEEAKLKVEQGADYNAVTEAVSKKLQNTLASSHLTSEEFDIILKGAVNLAYEGTVNIDSVTKKIKDAIENSKDEDFKKSASNFLDIIPQLDARIVQLLSDWGLLTKDAAAFLGDMGLAEIEQLFAGANGEIDGSIGRITLLNKVTEEGNKLEIERLEMQTKIAEADKKLDAYKKQGIIGNSKGATSIIESQGPQFNLPDTQAGGGGYRQPLGIMTKQQAEANSLAKEIENLNAKYKILGDTEQRVSATQASMISMFESAVSPSWQQMADDVKSAMDQLKGVSAVMEEIKSNEGVITGDTLAGLLETLEALSETAWESDEAFSGYMSALDGIINGLSMEDGMIHMNADSMTNLNNVLQENIKLKFRSQIASIEQHQTELRVQNEIIKAQMDAVKSAIEGATSAAEAETIIKEKLAQNLALIDKAEILNHEQKLKAKVQMDQEYARQLVAITKGGEGNINAITSSYTDKITTSLMGMVDKDDYKNSLQGVYDNLENQYNSNLGIINKEDELKKKLYAMLADPNLDLTKALGMNKTDKADEYIGKLEKTFSLLQKIARLTHKMEDNESLQDLYEGIDGEKYAQITKNNLEIAQEQYEVYKDLFAMQQEIFNQKAGDILDSPYGALFKVAENGALALDWDKYSKLPGVMQEEVDKLVESYEKAQDELEGTEKDLYDYAKAVKAAREETRDLYIQAENEILDAVKNREEKLHNARMKAFEDEIKMINDAKDARNKAREDRADEKDLYASQEALRRAMLDTSGKNNSELLSLQEALEEKQLEISEKRFDQDLEDRIDWLNDSKDAEDETYNYRLEKMTWYWEEVSTIMDSGTENILAFLKKYDLEYLTESEATQQKIEEDWRFTFTRLQTLMDTGVTFTHLTDGLKSVTSELEGMDVKIKAVTGSWNAATSAASNYKSAASGSGGGGGGGGTPTPPPKTPDTPNPPGGVSPGGVAKIDGMEYFNTQGRGIGCLDAKKGQNVPFAAAQTFQSNINGKQTNVYKLKNGNYVKASDFSKVYKEGGMVDYTGPAWVDGSHQKPEAFLSAYQTKAIGSLANSLDTSTVDNYNGGNVTIEGVSFNVASMSSVEDGRKALDSFVNGANDLMQKRGIGTRLNTNKK